MASRRRHHGVKMRHRPDEDPFHSSRPTGCIPINIFTGMLTKLKRLTKSNGERNSGSSQSCRTSCKRCRKPATTTGSPNIGLSLSCERRKCQRSLCSRCKCAYTPPTIESLPLEILEMILLETVMEQLKLRPISDCLIEETIRPLTTVCSTWKHCLTRDSFRLRLLSRTVHVTKEQGWVTIASYFSGVAFLNDSIYLLYVTDNMRSILVLRDKKPTILEEVMTVKETITKPDHLVSCHKTNCLYVANMSEDGNGCVVWRISVAETRITKWLCNLDKIASMSALSDGCILMLVKIGTRGQLGIYGSDAVLRQRIHLPAGITDPQCAVQTTNGHFIVSHKWKSSTSRKWVLSRLSSEGRVICQFRPSNVEEELGFPRRLCLDSGDHLLVADSKTSRIILFDSESLSWRQNLVSVESRLRFPNGLCCDRKDNRFATIGLGRILVCSWSCEARR